MKLKGKFSRNKLTYSVNEKFFKTWSRQMAYLLGFTYADGNIHITSLGWDLQKRDLDILEKIKLALKCTYPISLQRKSSYRLRISNQLLVNGAIKRGLLPKKNLREKIPQIPNPFLRHFIRGYLDGDGWLALRSGRNELDLGFSGCSKQFLEVLNKIISKEVGVNTGKVRKKVKITPRKVRSATYQLEFYSSNAIRIARWLYENLVEDDLYLNRKHRKYLKAEDLYQFLHSGPKKVRIIQKREGIPMAQILRELYVERKLDGVQIAAILGVHSSSIYRWLTQNGIKYPVKRVSTRSYEQSRRISQA